MNLPDEDLCQSQSDGAPADVVRDVHSDTFDVRFENGSADRLRLLGMDTLRLSILTSPSSVESREVGFADVVHFTSAQADARYFAGSSDGMLEETATHVMCATV